MTKPTPTVPDLPAADPPIAHREAPAGVRRRRVIGALWAVPAMAAAATLAGCGSSPPTRWYAMRSDPPPGVAVPSPARAGADAATTAARPEVWEVAPAVALPGVLDRDTLLVARGQAGVEALTGHRWAEPLRDSVPRLLLGDLLRLRGPGSTWPAPAPEGVQPARRLRVEVQTLLADAARSRLELRAAWWLSDPRQSASPPSAHEGRIEVPIDDPSADALAAAHRLAVWRLAERIAGGG